MSPLNHKKYTSSLAPPIIYAAKQLAIKRWKVPHCLLGNEKKYFKFIYYIKMTFSPFDNILSIPKLIYKNSSDEIRNIMNKTEKEMSK